jgi:hypothetical protein
MKTSPAQRSAPRPGPDAGGGPSASVDRRGALGLLCAGLAAGLGGARPAFAAAAAAAPFLATPEQIDAERRLLALEQDPALKQVQAQMRAELAGWSRAAIPDAHARIDEAVGQWTRSLLFGELTGYRARPAFLWGTDDTPRTWLGHTIGGVGTSGDNPDAIYRTAFLHGEGRYEIVGKFDMARRPAQLVIEFDRGDLTKPAQMMVPNPNHTDLGVQIALLTDRDLAIAPDGSFRLTVGPGPGGPHHITTEPGPVTVGTRDMLSDWSQRPPRLTVRRLDTAKPDPFDPAELNRRAVADLPEYIRFWARFPDRWVGGLKPNTHSQPTVRAGGWGAMSGLRFSLAPEEAVVVTTTQGRARYTGFQVIDPWMIAPDARRHQCCLNLSQAKPNADGSFTYVISPTDPGVANWLDTAGLHDGFGIIRWQALPPGARGEGLLREFRVASLSDCAKLDLPRVTPEERRKQVAARDWSYQARTR